MKKIIQLSQNDNATDNHPDTLDAVQYQQQVTVINEIFLGCYEMEATPPPPPVHKTYKQRIAKKMASYKTQDVANQIFDPRWFVEMDYVLELLVVSKLKCHYCRTNCAISYSKPRFDRQWTLDRICNEQGHNRGNVVISCLKCNLHRGVKPGDKYKLGKQMKFIKMHTSSYDEPENQMDLSNNNVKK